MRSLGVASVVLATALVYGPGLDAPFVFDDASAIVDNPALRQLATALDPPADSPLTGRPLVHATFALTYALIGLTPWAHRALNVLVHLLNALLLWTLLLRVLRRSQLPDWVRTRASAICGAVATLWTLHPLQTEAVAYVTQRTELLATSAVLATLHCAFTALERTHDRRFVLLPGLVLALGSGCKETVIIAPLLVLCLDVAFFSVKQRLLYLSMLLGLTPLFVLVLSAPRGQTAGFGLGVGMLDNLALQGQAIAWYLRLAAWPDRLSVTYNWPIDHALSRYWPADLVLLLLFALTLWLSLQRKRAALLGWFFFIALAPSSSLVPVISEMLAERRMYLGLAPVLTMLVLVLLRPTGRWLSPSRPRLWKAAAASCAIIALAYVARSRARISDYRSEVALFESALALAPDNPQAMWGLATAYEKRGDVERAAALYERMAEHPYPYVGPASWGTRGLIALAHLQGRRGQSEAAAATMRRALTHAPSSTIARLQHAADAAGSGERERARRELYRLLEQPFLHERIQLELGLIELDLGDEISAQAHLAEALRLAPSDDRVRARIAAAARGR